MAAYPKVGFYVQSTPSAQPMNIEAWTEHATRALGTVSISSPSYARGTSESLAIPLDDDPASNPTASSNQRTRDPEPSSRPRREPIRRDSLKRREALLKGKEGSRQRRRWENDRLLNNPWAQPPLPTDWEVHPTHPRHAVPYYLAPLWDEKVATTAIGEKSQRHAVKSASLEDSDASRITRELRGRLKKAKAAKGLLRDLEEQVRHFVQSWEEKAKAELADHQVHDSEDEEIVFVGKNGQMSDIPSSPSLTRGEEIDIPRDQLVFGSLADDQSASFGYASQLKAPWLSSLMRR
ncbi:MAG: hypothetical protein Q9191_001697 [Dirinaria sp. TL-2023a]